MIYPDWVGGVGETEYVYSDRYISNSSLVLNLAAGSIDFTLSAQGLSFDMSPSDINFTTTAASQFSATASNLTFTGVVPEEITWP